MSKYNSYQTFFLQTIVGSLFLLIIALPNFVEAYGMQGWFASKVEYVDDNLPATCNPATQASIEVVLLDKATNSQITGNIASWRVNVRRSKSDNSTISRQALNGQKQSGRICFDPTQNGLQVIISGNGDYRYFISPTIFSDNLDTNSLEEMRGSHFKSYVYLANSSSLLPDVEAVCVSNNGIDCDNLNFVNTNPTFFIKNNSVNTAFGSTEVRNTKLYIMPQDNSSAITAEIFVGDRSNNTYALSSSQDLPEGHYFWTFHQELNGQSVTERVASPPWTWTFGNLPFSGTPEQSSFTVDKTPPDSQFLDFAVSNTVNSSSVFDLSFRNYYTDSLSNVVENIVTVTDSTGNVVFGPQTYSDPSVNSIDVSLTSLTKGEVYTISSRVTDIVGNTTTVSQPYSLASTMTFNVPQVVLYNGVANFGAINVTNGVPGIINSSANELFGEITDRTTNPLPLLGTKMCWSLNPADIDTLRSGGAQTSSVDCVERSAIYNFNYFKHTAITPANETIYFVMAARNSQGWGYSERGDYNTPIVPYVDCGVACVPDVPDISMEAELPSPNSPTKIQARMKVDQINFSRITAYGFCWFTNPAVRDSFDPDSSTYASVMSDSSRCKIFSIPPDPEPQTNGYTTPWHTFTGLTPSTAYYFRAFAKNGSGTGYTSANQTTGDMRFDFRNDGITNLEFLGDDFLPSTDIYSKVTATLSTGDFSNMLVTSPRNEVAVVVNFTMDTDNDGVYNDFVRTVTREISVFPGGSSSFVPEEFVFNDVPLGRVRIETEINPAGDLRYPGERDPGNQINQRSNSFTITRPTRLTDGTGGDTTDSGGATDPNLTLEAFPSVIRKGETTDIKWTAENIDISCSLEGPLGFGGSLNPSLEGVLDSSGKKTDTETSPAMFNSQIFRFSCNSGAFSVTTRVTVIGDVQET